MEQKVTLRRALEDEGLLGSNLSGPSWAPWRAMLLAAMGEKLKPKELATFKALTKREVPPKDRVDEFWCIAGRRGGKTRAMASLAVYLSGLCDWSDNLAPGERGVVLIIAPDTRQAKIALEYAAGTLETPILQQLVARRTAEALELTNGITLEVRSASFRRIRGMTCVAVIADECAFWFSEDSANPDTEILNAARPALATTGGPLIAISSPYAQRGALFETYRRHFGPEGDPGILVAQGSSRDFNPSLPQSVIDRALERDEAAARAEYLGEFRSDVESFLSRAAIEECLISGCHELPPSRMKRYTAFVDPSGGVSDSMTLAISHKDGHTAILDAIREVSPPFSPESVVEEFASLCRSYRITRVRGDRYGGEFCREPFRRHGLNYQISDKSKSELFLDLLPMINSRSVDLLDDERLVRQLCGLERKTARGGRQSIDHRPGAHDDLANCVAGALVFAGQAIAVEWAPKPVVRLGYESAKRDRTRRIARRQRERRAGHGR